MNDQDKLVDDLAVHLNLYERAIDSFRLKYKAANTYQRLGYKQNLKRLNRTMTCYWQANLRQELNQIEKESIQKSNKWVLLVSAIVLLLGLIFADSVIFYIVASTLFLTFALSYEMALISTKNKIEDEELKKEDCKAYVAQLGIHPSSSLTDNLFKDRFFLERDKDTWLRQPSEQVLRIYDTEAEALVDVIKEKTLVIYLKEAILQNLDTKDEIELIDETQAEDAYSISSLQSIHNSDLYKRVTSQTK